MTTADFHFSPRPNRAAEVGWRAWSEPAFEEARRLDKPILLSISAVWCHWCHVMDETTYSNAGVIDLIKREFVPVRVDNDVRPDINQRYNMGGWPTTAFLTPSGDILTGGTYIPPEQMAAALSQIASVYRTNKAQIATRVLEGRKRAGSTAARSAGEVDFAQVDAILDAVRSAYDPQYGGFGPAPKFPQTDALALLLEQSQVRRDGELRTMAVNTLERMAGGGMYDHVEGGFFRYSTTQDWSVPHFEKMLEDHAGLIADLARAGMTEVLDSATGYLDRILRDPSTGLYAGSQDADEVYYSLDAERRKGETAPYVDRRVYSSWNCQLAIAYLDAARRCDRRQLRAHAQRLLESLFASAYTAGDGLRHTESAGGQLADQVWGMLAAVRAYQGGLGSRWLETALELSRHLDERYADDRLGGYFDRAAGAEQLGRLEDQIKPLVENSIAAIALVELDTLIGDPEQKHLGMARRALEAVAALPRQYGLMAALYARALDRLRRPVKVTTGSEELARAFTLSLPYAVIEPSHDQRAVVCVGTICLAPVSRIDAVEEAIKEALSISA
jgi:uncharacterized protein YyaL (SSP411 family)